MVRSTQRRLRWMVILYSFLVFIWSSLEDRHIVPVILLGGCGAFLIVLGWFTHRFSAVTIPRRLALAVSFVLGCAIGVTTSILTVVLMLLKNIRHAHLFPDYSAALMGGILERIPAWTVAGGFLGISIALLWIALRTQET